MEEKEYFRLSKKILENRKKWIGMELKNNKKGKLYYNILDKNEDTYTAVAIESEGRQVFLPYNRLYTPNTPEGIEIGEIIIKEDVVTNPTSARYKIKLSIQESKNSFKSLITTEQDFQNWLDMEWLTPLNLDEIIAYTYGLI